jgi:hypothetical protein
MLLLAWQTDSPTVPVKISPIIKQGMLVVDNLFLSTVSSSCLNVRLLHPKQLISRNTSVVKIP